MLFFFFFLPIMLFGNAQFLPIMLKIMPDYASKFYYIIEQEMTILSFTRNKK